MSPTCAPLPTTNESILVELQILIKRLSELKDSFNSLANDYGVNIPNPPDFAHMDAYKGPPAEGISSLRCALTEINILIQEINTERERLWQARIEILGPSDKKLRFDRPGSPHDPRWDNQRDVPREDTSGGCCRR